MNYEKENDGPAPGLVQVRAVLPAQKAFMVRRWEQAASAVGEVGNG